MSYRTLAERPDYKEQEKKVTMRQRISRIANNMRKKDRWNLLIGFTLSIFPASIIEVIGRVWFHFDPPTLNNEPITNPFGIFFSAFGVGLIAISVITILLLLMLAICSGVAALGEAFLDRFVAKIDKDS